MAMSKIKTVYNGGAAISMIGRETDPTASTNSYVKCFHINTSIMKTTTIKLKNYHASNLLTWKLLGYVDGIGGENETIYYNYVIDDGWMHSSRTPTTL